MSLSDDIKQRIDIVEVVGQYTSLSKAGRTFRALCPFHSEKHGSFFVYPEQQTWHCFGACNTGGDVFTFMMKKEGIDFGEALRLLAQRAGVTIPSRFEGSKKDEKEKLYQANGATAQYFHGLLLSSPAAESAKSYLSRRGLSSQAIADFQLGFSLNNWEALKQFLTGKGYTESELLEAGLIVTTEEKKTFDRFRGKLMFPIKDNRGRVTGFGSRVLDDSIPKYINSPQTPLFDKSGTLYGIDLAAPAIRQQNQAVIVEGYMDVIIAHQYGFKNVVASMGTAITDKQLNILKKLSRNMVLALDADSAGEEAMLRCVGYENTIDTEVKVAVLLQGKDPDDVIKEDTKTWQRLIDEALPVIDYAFNLTTSKFDLTKPAEKSLFRERLLPVIAEIKDTTRRDHYLTKLAKSIGTSYSNIESVLREYLTKRRAQKPKAISTNRNLSPVSNPREEYCLTLLLKYPKLKSLSPTPLNEYFENSENAEIFTACQQTDELESLKDKLTPAVWERFDFLTSREIVPSQIEEKYIDCVLSLKERYLRSLVVKRQIALEAEVEGSSEELAKLEEIRTELKEVFERRAKRGEK
ncbi:MAG: DNA primase [Chloroflexota bacterium]